MGLVVTLLTFVLAFFGLFRPDFRPVSTSHINTGAKQGKVLRCFVRLFNWLISDGRAAQLEKEEAARLDARAVACRIGEGSGLTEWRVVMQIRSQKADYDGVYTIRWESKRPPHVSELLHHLERSRQDFNLVTYLPNAHKMQSLVL